MTEMKIRRGQTINIPPPHKKKKKNCTTTRKLYKDICNYIKAIRKPKVWQAQTRQLFNQIAKPEENYATLQENEGILCCLSFLCNSLAKRGKGFLLNV